MLKKASDLIMLWVLLITELCVLNSVTNVSCFNVPPKQLFLKQLEYDEDVSKNINLNSRIAVVYDRKSGIVLYGKDENKRTAMASTTNVMET